MKKRAAQLAVSATENAYKPSVKIEETTSPASRTSCYNRVLRLITAIVIRKVRTCNAELLGAAGAAMGAKRRSGQSFISWMGTYFMGRSSRPPAASNQTGRCFLPHRRPTRGCASITHPLPCIHSRANLHINSITIITIIVIWPLASKTSRFSWD